jgi:ubiquinone biosynthesis UbiH/UbiF/VisC/COQ6 family hydroxylase
MDSDIIIVGGGPAGLSFARALAGSGLSLSILERQPNEALAAPAYDGREIALTRRSVETLKRLGAWERLADEEIAPLKTAKVINSASPLALTFDAGSRSNESLGMLVSNHCIRRTLFASAVGQDGLTLKTGATVASVKAGRKSAEVQLTDGSRLTGRLLVAADSRFSAARTQLGISAEMNRLGKAMLVCRVTHERDHQQVATEWFDSSHTIAMLPLNGRCSSAVVTLPLDEAEEMARLDDQALGERITRLYRSRLGRMRVESSRHLYPLVTTYARHFATPGAALIGDTAVGMHPVTAHGFNLGVLSAASLGEQILTAMRRGEDWAGDAVLRRYERAHRLASRPLYTATNLIVSLYNDPRPPAQFARHAAIRVGRRLPFFRGAVRSVLLQA